VPTVSTGAIVRRVVSTLKMMPVFVWITSRASPAGFVTIPLRFTPNGPFPVW